ncbi:MAG: hypothetical protein AAB114_00625 [Chloroflexota bacterium]
MLWLGHFPLSYPALFTSETGVQPKETKEAKKFEGFAQTRPLTCR